MSFWKKWMREPSEMNERADKALDPVLEEALKNFKASVHAWSDAACSRPRTVKQMVRRRSWRLAAGWALATVLMAGGVSGGVYERHQQKMRIESARAAEQQRLVAEQQAQEEEELLAKVDSDVSREVPKAMEPLAQLMAEDETQ